MPVPSRFKQHKKHPSTCLSFWLKVLSKIPAAVPVRSSIWGSMPRLRASGATVSKGLLLLLVLCMVIIDKWMHVEWPPTGSNGALTASYLALLHGVDDIGGVVGAGRRIAPAKNPVQIGCPKVPLIIQIWERVADLQPFTCVSTKPDASLLN